MTIFVEYENELFTSYISMVASDWMIFGRARCFVCVFLFLRLSGIRAVIFNFNR